jgi:hypothetical protein
MKFHKFCAVILTVESTTNNIYAVYRLCIYQNYVVSRQTANNVSKMLTCIKMTAQNLWNFIAKFGSKAEIC